MTRFRYDHDNYLRMDMNASGDQVRDAMFTTSHLGFARDVIESRSTQRSAGSFNNRIEQPVLVLMNLSEWNAFYGMSAHMRNLLLEAICPVLIEDDGKCELTEVEL